MSIGRNRPAPAASNVAVLQWANGITQGRQSGSKLFGPLTGFHIEQGKYEEIDVLLRELNLAEVEIKHRRPGGFEIKKHWHIGDSAWLHPVTEGPVADSIAGCLSNGNVQRMAEAGLGIAWPQGEKSKFAVQCVMILPVCQPFWVTLTTRSNMTDFLLAALMDYLRVCEAADALIDRDKHPGQVAFHEIAMHLDIGDETSVGKEASSSIYPFESAHPQVIDKAYLRQRWIWRSDDIDSMAKAGWPEIVEWARQFGAIDARGDER